MIFVLSRLSAKLISFGLPTRNSLRAHFKGFSLCQRSSHSDGAYLWLRLSGGSGFYWSLQTVLAEFSLASFPQAVVPDCSVYSDPSCCHSLLKSWGNQDCAVWNRSIRSQYISAAVEREFPLWDKLLLWTLHSWSFCLDFTENKFALSINGKTIKTIVCMFFFPREILWLWTIRSIS